MSKVAVMYLRHFLRQRPRQNCQGEGSESWERGETEAEAGTLRPRHGRWRLRPGK